MLLSPITIGKETLSGTLAKAGLDAMVGTFTNMDIASVFGRAGFAPNDLWTRQEAANRLLQKAREAGLVEYNKKQWRRKTV